jgi:hypothetical protein
VHTKLNNINIKKENFFNPNDNTIVFNKYKTENKFGSQTVKITDEQLLNFIEQYIEFAPTRQFFLFKNHKIQPFTLSDMSKRMSEIFADIGDHVTINDVRIAFVKEVYKPYEKIEKNSEQIGHTVQTANSFYNKKINFTFEFINYYIFLFNNN